MLIWIQCNWCEYQLDNKHTVVAYVMSTFWVQAYYIYVEYQCEYKLSTSVKSTTVSTSFSTYIRSSGVSISIKHILRILLQVQEYYMYFEYQCEYQCEYKLSTSVLSTSVSISSSTSILSTNVRTSSKHVSRIPLWVQTEFIFMSAIVSIACYIHCEHVWAQALYIYCECQCQWKHCTSFVIPLSVKAVSSFKCSAVIPV